MSVHMRTHPTKQLKEHEYLVSGGGLFFEIPRSFINKISKYKTQPRDPMLIEAINELKEYLSKDKMYSFEKINKKYTKPGAILKGIRLREGMTQLEFAKDIEVKQYDISKMENGKRPIGKIIAKRIAKRFDINYRILL